MTCREFADFIHDYLANELRSDLRREFEHHLRLCQNCGRYLASYVHSVQLGKRAFDDEEADLPGSVPEELVQAILRARARG